MTTLLLVSPSSQHSSKWWPKWEEVSHIKTEPPYVLSSLKPYSWYKQVYIDSPYETFSEMFTLIIGGNLQMVYIGFDPI